MRLTRTAFTLLSFVLLLGLAHAQYCPECDIGYALCSWDCYAKNGWDPVCSIMTSAPEEAVGATPDPSSATLFANKCEVQCYMEYLASKNMISSEESSKSPNTQSQCEDVWKQKSAMEYERIQNGFYPDSEKEKLASASPWVINMVENTNIAQDESTINANWQRCSICDVAGPTGDTSVSQATAVPIQAPITPTTRQPTTMPPSNVSTEAPTVDSTMAPMPVTDAPVMVDGPAPAPAVSEDIPPAPAPIAATTAPAVTQTPKPSSSAPATTESPVNDAESIVDNQTEQNQTTAGDTGTSSGYFYGATFATLAVSFAVLFSL